MQTFYFYFNLNTCQLKQVSDIPRVILKNEFVIDQNLNTNEDGSPIFPQDWQSNSALLLKILRFKRARLIEKTQYVMTQRDNLTEQQLNDWYTYWAALATLPSTANMDGIVLETLNTLFPTQPEVGIIPQMD